MDISGSIRFYASTISRDISTLQLPAKIGDYPQICLKGPKLADVTKNGWRDQLTSNVGMVQHFESPRWNLCWKSDQDHIETCLGYRFGWKMEYIYIYMDISPKCRGNSTGNLMSFSIKLAIWHRDSRWFTFLQLCRHGNVRFPEGTKILRHHFPHCIWKLRPMSNGDFAAMLQ